MGATGKGAADAHFGVLPGLPIRFSNPSAFPQKTAVFETHIPRETVFPEELPET